MSPNLSAAAIASATSAASRSGADPELILELTGDVQRTATDKIAAIQKITGRTKILALNALIEAARAGEFGRGFSVVANEVKSISAEVENIAQTLQTELATQVSALDELGRRMVEHVRGTRLIDLSLNAIEIIDRNLYERTCDVRWWATDSAVVACAEAGTPETSAHAAERLGVILGAYTVYLDLWICSLDGRVIASGRPARYPSVTGSDMREEAWFSQALGTRSGDEYAVADITVSPRLEGRSIATYSAAIREGVRPDGRPIGVLAAHFDWGPQAQTVVDGVRLNDDERVRTRVMLLDANHRVLAASDRRGVLQETVPLATKGASGTYVDRDGNTVGYARTPGYETYRGLGWYGCIVQRRSR